MFSSPGILTLGQGLNLAVFDTGGAGPVLLLLPGNSLSVESTYSALAAEPALAGYRRVAFDWPGCGASPWAPDWYGLARLTQALQLAMTALALPSPLVVGHSLGGHLALAALPKLPKVGGLLLVGTPPLGSATDLSTAFLPDPRMALLYQADLTDADLAQLLPALLRPDAPAPLQAQLAKALRQSDPAFRTLLAAEIGTGNLTDEQAVLRSTTVPVAFALGEADALVSATHVRAVAAPSRWGAPLHVLPGTGHTPMLEAPAAFAALVARFGRAVLAQ